MSLPSPGDRGLVTDNSVSHTKKKLKLFPSLCVNFKGDRDKKIFIFWNAVVAFFDLWHRSANPKRTVLSNDLGGTIHPARAAGKWWDLQWELREKCEKRPNTEESHTLQWEIWEAKYFQLHFTDSKISIYPFPCLRQIFRSVPFGGFGSDGVFAHVLKMP